MSKKVAPPTFHIQGQFVRQTFLRLYKKKMSATNEQAETKFQSMLKSGLIVFVKFSGLIEDVPVYEFKK